jgi:hypothetical protein
VRGQAEQPERARTDTDRLPAFSDGGAAAAPKAIDAGRRRRLCYANESQTKPSSQGYERINWRRLLVAGA